MAFYPTPFLPLIFLASKWKKLREGTQNTSMSLTKTVTRCLAGGCVRSGKQHWLWTIWQNILNFGMLWEPKLQVSFGEWTWAHIRMIICCGCLGCVWPLPRLRRLRKQASSEHWFRVQARPPCARVRDRNDTFDLGSIRFYLGTKSQLGHGPRETFGFAYQSLSPKLKGYLVSRVSIYEMIIDVTQIAALDVCLRRTAVSEMRFEIEFHLSVHGICWKF